MTTGGRINMNRDTWYSLKNGEIAPFPKELYDLCMENTVDKVVLSWEGGSDEGYLQVTVWLVGENNWNDQWGRPDTMKAVVLVLEEKIQDWADGCIEYNGAGEGSPYGHDLTIDLTNEKVTLDEWWNQRVDDNVLDGPLELNGGEGQ
jgi:hypothetical protein